MSCDIIQVTVSESSGETSVVEVGQNIHNFLLGLQGGVSGEYFHLTSGEYSNLNSFQSKNLYLSGITTGASLTELFYNETGTLEVPSGKNILFKGDVTAIDLNNFKSAAWEFKCLLANKTGSVEKVGFSQVTKIADDSSGVWNIFINTNSGVDHLQVNVQGQSSSTIKWISSVESVSIS